jgi:hypothetical protein
MATALNTETKRAREIFRLGMERLSGKITQRELEASVDAVLTKEPELPLGVGAVMPEGEPTK